MSRRSKPRRPEEDVMLLVKAIEILERMRDGKTAVAGRIETDPSRDADVVRALYTVLGALPKSARRKAKSEADEPSDAEAESPRKRPARTGKPWTDEEDRVLATAFDEGRGVPDIARVLDRSAKAVRLRLVKLGRLSADEAPKPRRRRVAEAAAAP